MGIGQPQLALDFSKPGAPTTRETFIEQVDPTAAGGLKIVSDLAVSEEADAYKAPDEE